MFTQQAPLLLSALNPAMPADSARQVAQVFANCNQALTHRGSVNLQGQPFAQQNGVITAPNAADLPPWAFGNQAGNGQTYPFGGAAGSFYGGNYYGVDGPTNALQFAYRPGNASWANYSNSNAANYVNNFFVAPPASGGYRSGDWITYTGDNNMFDVAPRITNNISQNYGGPTFQVAGDTVFDNTVTNNSYVNNTVINNLITNTVNGEPVKGDKGDPGVAGPGGAPGRIGDPGLANPVGAVPPAGGGGVGGMPGVGLGPINVGGAINIGIFIGGGGRGGGGFMGPPGPPGRPGEMPPGALATLQDVNRNLRKLMFDFETLQRKLSTLNMEATIDENCNIILRGQWPDVVGGVQAA